MVYGIQKGGRGGEGSYVAQKSCNSNAVVWAMQMGGGVQGRIVSCTKASK